MKVSARGRADPGQGRGDGVAATADRPRLLPGLTGLRGVGALWVVVYHAQYGLGLPIADAGYLGVDLFFILSGFVLSHAHQDFRFSLKSYGAFVRSRFARIFPLHWAVLLLVAAAITVVPTISDDMPNRFGWPSFISSVLLMQNWGLGNPATWNIPAWSLSTEWLVSLMFPMFLLSARMVRRPISAASLCVACLVAFVAVLWLTGNPDPNVIGRAGIIRTVCEFSAGCLLHRLYLFGTRVDWIAAVASMVLILLGVLVPGAASVAVFGLPAVMLFACQPDNFLTRTLVKRGLAVLGEISFSIYLSHWILLQIANRVRPTYFDHGALLLVWFALYLSVVIVVSFSTYSLIEVPARQWLRGAKFRTKPSAAVQPRPVV